MQSMYVLVFLANATPGTRCVGCALTEVWTGGVRPAVEMDCVSDRFSVFDSVCRSQFVLMFEMLKEQLARSV